MEKEKYKYKVYDTARIELPSGSYSKQDIMDILEFFEIQKKSSSEVLARGMEPIDA